MNDQETGELLPGPEAPGQIEIPAAEPVTEPSEPMQVVSVDELLEYLQTPAEGELPEADEPGELEADAPAELPEETQLPAETDETAQLLELIHQDLTHPALTTDFQDYTVAEGLLLLLLVGFFISACIRLLKEGFSWL